MPRNVEIKARLKDPAAMRRRVEELARGPGEVLTQDDTFYAVPRGRLKLRVLGAQHGELIYYERPDGPGPRESHYLIARTDEPAALGEVLARSLGVLGRVRKRRTVYIIGQTRVHLDEVDGLGHFVELEVVLAEGQPTEEGIRIARGLMRRLGVRKADLLAASYLDLLGSPPPNRAREGAGRRPQHM